MRKKLILLQILSFIVSVAPVCIVMATRWDVYTKMPSDTVKLCIGGLLVLLFVFLKVIGKLKMPSRIVFFGLVFLMSYLLQSILDDLILLSGMALIGEFVDYFVFQPWIKRTREKIQMGKQADATTEKLKEVLENYGLTGRV